MKKINKKGAGLKILVPIVILFMLFIVLIYAFFSGGTFQNITDEILNAISKKPDVDPVVESGQTTFYEKRDKANTVIENIKVSFQEALETKGICIGTYALPSSFYSNGNWIEIHVKGSDWVISAKREQAFNEEESRGITTSDILTFKNKDMKILSGEEAIERFKQFFLQTTVNPDSFVFEQEKGKYLSLTRGESGTQLYIKTDIPLDLARYQQDERYKYMYLNNEETQYYIKTNNAIILIPFNFFTENECEDSTGYALSKQCRPRLEELTNIYPCNGGAQNG